MRRKFLLSSLAVFLLAACSAKAVSDPPAALPSATPKTGHQPTETQLSAPTIAPTSTTAPTETPPPTQTPIPTLAPDYGLLPWQESGASEPQSSPAAEWCGIPVMQTAVAGDSFDGTVYLYKTNSSPMDIYQFYLAELPKLNWEIYLVGTNAVDAVPVETADMEEFHATLFFQKGSFSEQGSITMLEDYNSHLIYVMLICGF